MKENIFTCTVGLVLEASIFHCNFFREFVSWRILSKSICWDWRWSSLAFSRREFLAFSFSTIFAAFASHSNFECSNKATFFFWTAIQVHDLLSTSKDWKPKPTKTTIEYFILFYCDFNFNFNFNFFFSLFVLLFIYFIYFFRYQK